MKLIDPRKIIRKPVITEKATMWRNTSNSYAFFVHADSTKEQVKHSIEKLFSVDVVSVRIMNISGKPRRRGIYTGRTAMRKKAIVKLKNGQTIPIFEGLV